MAIPLFTGSGGISNVRPLTLGADSIESLEMKGRLAGAQLAESYEQVQNAQQAREIRANEERREQELQPLRLESERLRLDATRQALSPEAQELNKLKIAQDTKLIQDKNELTQVMQSNDPQAIVGAVTSGRYADVFAESKQLQDYAFTIAGQYMSPEQIRRFQAMSQNDDVARALRAEALKTNAEFAQTQSSFTSNDTLRDLADNYYQGKLSDAQVADRVVFLPSNSYKVDPKTQEPINEGGRLPDFESSALDEGATRFYDAFDKETGNRIARGIEPDTKKLFSQYKTQRGVITRYNVPTNLISGRTDSINRAAVVKEQTEQQRSPVAGPTQAAAGPTPSPVPAPTPVPSSNTPDTNQAPVASARRGVEGKIAANPSLQNLQNEAGERRRKQAEQMRVGKENASFDAAIFDTKQMFSRASYRPADVKNPVVTRVNAEPLLADKSPLIKAIAAVESGGKRNAKSPTGVRGLMQVTKSTAAQYGLDRNIPAQNVEAGERELYRNLKLTKSPELALAAYNAGIGTILEAIQATNSYDWDVVKDYLRDNLPRAKFREVENYPAKVLNYAALFAGAEMPEPAVEAEPQIVETAPGAAGVEV